MVFKLCLSTLIGNLLLKEFLIFFSSLCCWFDAESYNVRLCMLCERFTFRFFLLLVRETEEKKKQDFPSVIPPSSSHLSISHWHWAIKYQRHSLLSSAKFPLEKHKILNFYSKLFLCAFNGTCSIPFFLSGSIKPVMWCYRLFNIIDFLCHYQPLALLGFLFFLVLCTQKCFCIGTAEKKQQRKKHKIQKKAGKLGNYKHRLLCYKTHTPNDMVRQI